MLEVDRVADSHVSDAAVVVLDTAPLLAELLGQALSRHGIAASAIGATGASRGSRPERPGETLLLVAADGRDDEVAARVTRWRGEAPGARVVLLVPRADRGTDALARTVGAVGWVTRQDSLPDLVAALREAAAGAPTRRATEHGKGEPGPGHGAATLTAREVEVLSLVAGGDSDDAVAARLRISVHTVRTHLASARAKLGVASRFAAVAAVRRAGLLSPRPASSRDTVPG